MLTHLSFTLFEVKSFFVPCPLKWLTGFDCPGCGFQRSLWALLQGEFQESFKLYPPLSAFLISFLATMLVYVFKWDRNSLGLKSLYFGTGVFVLVNYCCKIATGLHLLVFIPNFGL